MAAVHGDGPADRARVSDINIGPAQPSRLTQSERERAQALWLRLQPVYAMDEDEWIRGFERDADPGHEIEWWERLATAYEEAAAELGVDDSEKAALFARISIAALSGATESSTAEAGSSAEIDRVALVCLRRNGLLPAQD